MNRSIIGGMAVAAGVALSLGLGVREGVARSAGEVPAEIPAAQPLTYQTAAARAHPRKAKVAAASWASSAVRRPYCSDEADCQATCDAIYPGQETVGFCSSGHTCYCYGALRSAPAQRRIASR